MVVAAIGNKEYKKQIATEIMHRLLTNLLDHLGPLFGDFYPKPSLALVHLAVSHICTSIQANYICTSESKHSVTMSSTIWNKKNHMNTNVQKEGEATESQVTITSFNKS